MSRSSFAPHAAQTPLYLTQFVWMLPFSHQIPSLLLLQALLLSLIAATLWAIRNDGLGVLAAVAFLFLPTTLELNTQVMSEPAAIFLGRWFVKREFRALGAWLAYTWRITNEGLLGPANLGLLWEQGGAFLRLLPTVMGWPMAAAMAAGDGSHRPGRR